MARGKGHYNKDCERARHQKKQYAGKYKNPTAVRLREKLTGESMQTEMKKDYNNLYENHYNACYSDFAKRTLKKNHGFVEKNYETYEHLKDETFQDFMYKAFLTQDPNLQQFGEVDIGSASLVFYNYSG